MTLRARRFYWGVLILAMMAAAYRLFLVGHYYGWEESDYGNLAMTRGVLESGFRDFDMRHLPLYYFLSAVVLAIVGDTILAAKTVALVSGTLCVVLAALIARKVWDESTALVTGFLLVFQPEYALYASSSLRDPLFTCLVLSGCLALLVGRHRLAAILTGFSFLTRFDSLATNMTAVCLHLMRRPPRLLRLRHPMWQAVAIFGVFLAGWSTYCGLKFGQWIFFLPTVQVNIDTGGAQEIVGAGEFIREGIGVSAAMFFSTLPNHLGFTPWLLALGSIFVQRRELLNRTGLGTLFTYLILNTGFWLAVGFIGQHEPEHNLYWIWMYTLISFWLMFAARAMVLTARRLRQLPWLAGVVLCLIGVTTVSSFARQTLAQVGQSARLYKPQVEVARWVEENVPTGETLIFDNIPACYLDRKKHGWKLISWFDVPVSSGDKDGLAHFIRAHSVRYVLWFKEEWTQAPSIAPYLSEPVPTSFGGLRLMPLFHEEEYGFIFYRVDDPSKN